MTRFGVWRRRSTIQMGCPAFVPGFLLCGHSHSFILIQPATCWQWHNRSNPEAAEGLTVRAFEEDKAKTLVLSRRNSHNFVLSRMNFSAQFVLSRRNWSFLKITSNQSWAISLESVLGLAWMSTMQ